MPDSELVRKQRAAITRIAALVLVNAMMFEEVLAQKDARVRPLQDFRHEPDPVSAFADHWKFILDEINYHPIFNVALQLIRCISSDKDSTNAIHNLIGIARQIVDWRASLRHDLAGRIYHRILAEAKYLGAYYTSIPAAALLAKLALRPNTWAIDWADAITDNHIYAAVESKKKPQLRKLHEVVNERALTGFDVLHSAVHLTASTLALRVPDVEVNLTNLSTLPFAAGHDELGSIEFFPTDTVTAASLFGQQPERLRGKGPVKGPVTLPMLDLCIMNPPFTSSRKGNLLFGSIPEADRTAMRKRLQKLVKECKIPASITAGLGAVFVALGDKYLKEQGRLALVLQRSILSGVSWEKTRRLLEKSYQLEYVIVSHEAGHWNFSENTSLSEVLIVAQKLRKGNRKRHNVTFVNLWRNPRNTLDALALARSIQQSTAPDLRNLKGPASLSLGSAKFGEVVGVPHSGLRDSIWVLPCAYAQSELLRVCHSLNDGAVTLPGHKARYKVPLCKLGSLAQLGPDPRDLADGFAPTAAKTAYPALLGAKRMFTLSQEPNQYLDPRSVPLPGRPLRDFELLWPRAGRLLVAMRTRLNTKRLTAVRVSTRVLSDVWWPVSLTSDVRNETKAEKALVIWLNSTLGMLLMFSHREETEGAFVQYKKPVLEGMPVLNVKDLSQEALAELATAYDELKESPLLPLPNMATDPIRAKIDCAICDALRLPDISVMRDLLAQEPLLAQDMRRLGVHEGLA